MAKPVPVSIGKSYLPAFGMINQACTDGLLKSLEKSLTFSEAR